MTTLEQDRAETAAAADRPITGLDRCDSCGAQAYVRVTLASGDLYFCAHHGTKFREKLSDSAIVWHDESARLLAGLGCDVGQGYHIARPMPAHQVKDWLMTHRAKLNAAPGIARRTG